MQYIKSSCQKALDILRVVEHTDWGADRIVLPRFYRALVRSKWDYGSIVYGSARRSVLKHLDPIHHQGLCIALGAFRTSPAQSLHVEAHEPSLTSRRLKLSLNYALKLNSLPQIPAYSCVFEPENIKLFEESESKIPPLGIRILPHLEKCKLDLNLIDAAPAVRLDLAKLKKEAANPEIYKQFYLQIISDFFFNFFFFFTNGSETEAGVSTKYSWKTLTCRLPDDSSIYTAELRAILLRIHCLKEIIFNTVCLTFITESYI